MYFVCEMGWGVDMSRLEKYRGSSTSWRTRRIRLSLGTWCKYSSHNKRNHTIRSNDQKTLRLPRSDNPNFLAPPTPPRPKALHPRRRRPHAPTHVPASSRGGWLPQPQQPDLPLRPPDPTRLYGHRHGFRQYQFPPDSLRSFRRESYVCQAASGDRGL